MAGHVVVPNGQTMAFDVVSGSSGKTYTVTTQGQCNCYGFEKWHSCSHLKAVLAHAEEALAAVKRGNEEVVNA